MSRSARVKLRVRFYSWWWITFGQFFSLAEYITKERVDAFGRRLYGQSIQYGAFRQNSTRCMPGCARGRREPPLTTFLRLRPRKRAPSPLLSTYICLLETARPTPTPHRPTNYRYISQHCLWRHDSLVFGHRLTRRSFPYAGNAACRGWNHLHSDSGRDTGCLFCERSVVFLSLCGSVLTEDLRGDGSSGIPQAEFTRWRRRLLNQWIQRVEIFFFVPIDDSLSFFLWWLS